MSRYWSLFALLVVIFGTLTFVVAPTTLLWDKEMWLPADYSDHGHEIDHLFYFILLLTGITFLATESILFYFMWKYDGATNKKPVVYSHGSHTLEIVWTIIPAATLLFIAIYQFNSWAEVKMRSPLYGPDGIAGNADDMLPTVEVTARQWEWRVRYPGEDGKLGTTDDVYDVNELHVPANQDVVVALKSNDILHSFFIPNLRIKQDAVPGMKIPVWFKVNRKDPKQELSFEIVCAEHCGARHYAMKGMVYVHTPEEYQDIIRRKYRENNAVKDPQVAASAGGEQ